MTSDSSRISCSHPYLCVAFPCAPCLPPTGQTRPACSMRASSPDAATQRNARCRSATPSACTQAAPVRAKNAPTSTSAPCMLVLFPHSKPSRHARGPCVAAGRRRRRGSRSGVLRIRDWCIPTASTVRGLLDRRSAGRTVDSVATRCRSMRSARSMRPSDDHRGVHVGQQAHSERSDSESSSAVTTAPPPGAGAQITVQHAQPAATLRRRATHSWAGRTGAHAAHKRTRTGRSADRGSSARCAPRMPRPGRPGGARRRRPTPLTR